MRNSTHTGTTAFHPKRYSLKHSITVSPGSGYNLRTWKVLPDIYWLLQSLYYNGNACRLSTVELSWQFCESVGIDHDSISLSNGKILTLLSLNLSQVSDTWRPVNLGVHLGLSPTDHSPSSDWFIPVAGSLCLECWTSSGDPCASYLFAQIVKWNLSEKSQWNHRKFWTWIKWNMVFPRNP